MTCRFVQWTTGNVGKQSFADLVALVLPSGCDRIDKVVVSEAADIGGYDSPATELPVGFGRPIDDPGLAENDRVGDVGLRGRRSHAGRLTRARVLLPPRPSGA